jgi:putative CocE/NonD family hydrolase
MKRILLAFSFVWVAVFAQAQDSTEINESWMRMHYTKWEKMIPMRDGVKLFTSIYFPKDSTEKHPILMSRTPYSCYPYGENNYKDLWNGYQKEYLKEHYIIVLQDVRGKFMSEGEFEDVRPFKPGKKNKKDIDESTDAYDAIDWLIKHVPMNNGKVGVMGISYPGFYSTMAALSGHPALVAVSPQAPVTDWFMGDDFHHNGAFFVMDGFDFYSGFGKPRPQPTKEWPEGFKFPGPDNYKFYLETGALKNFAKLMGDSIKFWKDLYAHPNYDNWWKARNPRNFVNNIKPAMLVVGGLFDAEDCFGAWNLYKAIEQKNPADHFNKLVMGPWFHGQWAGRGEGAGSYLGNIQFGAPTAKWYQDSIEVPFFHYYLKGKGDVAAIKEATIFFSGENQWHKLDQWPPNEMKETPIYFGKDGSLDWNKPADSVSSFTEYISDPAKPVPYTEGVHLERTREYMTDDQRFASRRPDVLVFQTNVLAEDLTLAGPIVADLAVSISSTDADFVVKVIDVFPDTFRYEKDIKKYPMGGYQMLVRGEIMRGRYRNSFESPQPFIPNRVTHVKFTLPDIAHTFKKGHKLMIQVQSSWFPLVDRNPQQFVNIYNCDDKDFKKATIRLHHDAKNTSLISLPVIAR